MKYINFKCFPSDALAEAGKEGFVFPQGTTARLSAACMGLASRFDASMSLPFDLARGLDKGAAHQYKHHACMVDLLVTGIPEEQRPASFTYQSGAHKGMPNLDSRGEVVKRLLQQHPQLRGEGDEGEGDEAEPQADEDEADEAEAEAAAAAAAACSAPGPWSARLASTLRFAPGLIMAGLLPTGI